MLSISKRYKFVFIHIPKTGGISFAKALEDFADVPIPSSHFHATLPQAANLIKGEDLGKYVKFCVVRNPFDWFVSLYFHHLNNPELDLKTYNFIVNNKIEAVIDYCFNELKLRQSYWLAENGPYRFDYVLRFESLDSDVQHIAKKLGLQINLPQINKTQHRVDYKLFFDRKSAKKFIEYYIDDFKYAGYSASFGLFGISLTPKYRNIDDLIATIRESSEKKVAALLSHESDPDFLIVHIQELIDAGKNQQAKDYIDKLLSLDPTSSRGYLQKSFVLMALGEIQDSIAAARRSVLLDPKNDLPIGHLANLYRENSELDRAENHYRRAIQINPLSGSHHYGLSLTLAKKNMTDDAISEAVAAVRLDPQLDIAFAHLGYLHSVQRKFTEAEQCYRNAIEIKPHDATYHHTLSLILSRQSRTQEAIDEAIESLNLDSNLDAAQNHLGSLLLERGEDKLAEQCFRQAIHVNPNVSGYHFGLSMALDKQNRFDDALSEALEAVRLEPSLDLAQNHLGYLYTTASEFKKAENCFRAAISIRPDYSPYIDSLNYVLSELEGKAGEESGRAGSA